MASELVKRLITKEGSHRISFYREEYAENPRYMTDEPLHCEDWSRDCSIMTKDERSKSSCARNLLEYMLRNYGDYKKIVGALVDNGKKMDRERIDFGSALVYDRSRKGYVLYETASHYYSFKRENGWYENAFFDGKRDDLDLCYILEEVCDEAINYFAEHCMTDGVKIASYSFGYYGEVSFSDNFDTDSEGLCWLEKDEFLKYPGCSEEQWNGKTLREIEWLCNEIEAWSNNDVYGFVVEECIKSKIHKEYTNVDKEAEDYEETEWNNTYSCWGFYGGFDKMADFMIEDAGFSKDDFAA